MICPKCGGTGKLVSYEYRAWGIMPPQILYKGECLNCGFVAHQSGKPEGAEEYFINGLTRNPLFDQWREAQAKIDAAKAAKGKMQISLSELSQAQKRFDETQEVFPPIREKVFHPGIKADCAFICKGDCMKPTFIPGELALIHRQESFIDGQIVAVDIGTGMILKRMYHLQDGFRFVMDNGQKYQPFTITGEQVEKVKIFGIAVARR